MKSLLKTTLSSALISLAVLSQTACSSTTENSLTQNTQKTVMVHQNIDFTITEKNNPEIILVKNSRRFQETRDNFLKNGIKIDPVFKMENGSDSKIEVTSNSSVEKGTLLSTLYITTKEITKFVEYKGNLENYRVEIRGKNDEIKEEDKKKTNSVVIEKPEYIKKIDENNFIMYLPQIEQYSIKLYGQKETDNTKECLEKTIEQNDCSIIEKIQGEYTMNGKKYAINAIIENYVTTQ